MNEDRFCSHATQRNVELIITGDDGEPVHVRLDQLPLITHFSGQGETFYTFAYEQGSEETGDWQIRMARLKCEDLGPVALGALLRMAVD